MSTLGLIVLFTALSGLLSAFAAGFFMLLGDRRRAAVQPHLVSFATGTLLAAAFVGLLPHALERSGPSGAHGIGLALLLGVLTFFILEKFVLWRHCHDDPCEMHSPDSHSHGPSDTARAAATAKMILAGDGFHNVLDGVLLAAAFMTDTSLGIVTALAIFSHEIPQEVGDLAILLHGGYSRGRAMLLNLLTSLTSVIGGVVAYFALGTAMGALPYAIAFAASSFIYISVADLIPGLHRRVDLKAGFEQLLFIGLGAGIVILTHRGMH